MQAPTEQADPVMVEREAAAHVCVERAPIEALLAAVSRGWHAYMTDDERRALETAERAMARSFPPAAPTEVERLTRELAEARAALRPFVDWLAAEESNGYATMPNNWGLTDDQHGPSLGDLRRARAALSPTPQDTAP